MPRRKLNPAIALLVAVICLLVAAAFAIHTSVFLKNSVRTTGTIVDLRAKTDKEGSTSYSPTFAFRDAAGIEHRIESTLSQRPSPYTVGQSVPVLYRGSNPESALIDRFMELWFVPALFVGASLMWTVIGVVLFIRR